MAYTYHLTKLQCATVWLALYDIRYLNLTRTQTRTDESVSILGMRTRFWKALSDSFKSVSVIELLAMGHSFSLGSRERWPVMSDDKGQRPAAR